MDGLVKKLLISAAVLAIALFIALYPRGNKNVEPVEIIPSESHMDFQASSAPETIDQGTVEQELQAAQDAPAPVAKLKDIFTDEIEKQNDIDQMLLSELNTHSYFIDDPLVIVDPYGTSPLTALAIFSSETPSNISFFIEGKDELSNISFTFDGYNTDHLIPIYGLYAGKENRVVLTAKTEAGEETQKELLITTDPVNTLLEQTSVKAHVFDASKYQPGLNFGYDASGKAVKYAFDSNGDYRWYTLEEQAVPLAPMSYFVGGTEIFFSYGAIHEGDTAIVEKNPLGKIKNVYYSDYGAHHDIEICDDGTMIITGSKGTPSNATIEDFLYRMDLKTGAIVDELSYLDVLPRTRHVGLHMKPFVNYDWMHNNSVVEYMDDVIVSSNFQSAILRNSWDGEIKWILAPDEEWTPQYETRLLTPIGSNFEYSYNQHAVDLLPDYDNNPDTVDIIVFDNGTSRGLDGVGTLKDVAEDKNKYSRLVHYRINEKNMTVEQIREFGKNYPALYSGWRGDADLLPNGNWLGAFNARFETYLQDEYPISDNSINVEVDENDTIVWESLQEDKGAQSSLYNYRLERLPIYEENANNLEIGVAANNYILSSD